MLKTLKYNSKWWVIVNIFYYIFLVLVIIFASVIIAGWLVNRNRRKAMKDYNLYVETKKSRLQEKKINYIEKLNCIESKLSRTTKTKKQDKLNRKKQRINQQIDNIDKVIAVPIEVKEPTIKEPTKLDNLLETKINEIKENVL